MGFLVCVPSCAILAADLYTPISKLGGAAREKQWPMQISAALIGSCTNSSYEDMTRSASIARQAKEKVLNQRKKKSKTKQSKK